MLPPCNYQSIDGTNGTSADVASGLTQQLEPIRVREAPEVILLRLFANLDGNPDDANVMRQILDAITSIIPCAQAIFYEWTAPGGQFDVTREASTDPALLKDYFAQAHAIDPCTQDKTRQQCIQSARSQTLADVLPRDAKKSSPFVTHFLDRNNRLQHALCHHASVSSDHYVSLHLFRRVEQPAFSSQEKTCLDHLLAHVVLWLRQRWALRVLRQERDALQLALDAQSAPVFLLDRHAHVLASNHSAYLQLREGRRLSLLDNTLRPGSQMDHASWIPEAIERLLSSDSSAESVHIHLQALPCLQGRHARHYGVLARAANNAYADPTTVMLTMIDTRPSGCTPRPSGTASRLRFHRCRSTGGGCLGSGHGHR